jgi:hypothetical protein
MNLQSLRNSIAGNDRVLLVSFVTFYKNGFERPDGAI